MQGKVRGMVVKGMGMPGTPVLAQGVSHDGVGDSSAVWNAGRN